MAKRKKGQPVHGWIVFNKPLGMTSSQAVAFVKRTFDAQKAGHGGTLDPLATGVLPIALGEATKTMNYLLSADKHYEFTVKWGSETNTDDLEGEVVKSSVGRPSKEAIEQIMQEFVGEIEQTPPAYSAIKIDGKPAYARARSGEDVEMQSRKITVYKMDLVAVRDDEADFIVHASKGTYVRALGRDMGRKLECYGHISRLHRIKAGKFDISQTVSKENLDECLEKGHSPHQFLLDTTIALVDIPAYIADPLELSQLKLGRTLVRIHLKPGVMKVIGKGQRLESLIEVKEGGEVKILRNFVY